MDQSLALTVFTAWPLWLASWWISFIHYTVKSIWQHLFFLFANAYPSHCLVRVMECCCMINALVKINIYNFNCPTLFIVGSYGWSEINWNVLGQICKWVLLLAQNPNPTLSHFSRYQTIHHIFGIPFRFSISPLIFQPLKFLFDQSLIQITDQSLRRFLFQVDYTSYRCSSL